MGNINLQKASPKAIKYSCKHYHYSKTNPANAFGYSVFDNDTFCGVILFGSGANNNIGKSYGLVKGEIVELVRVALNGKQSKTSQCLAIALKLLKKDNPLIKLVVSYADNMQGHFGTIYKATNWIYVGETYHEIGVRDPYTKEIRHNKSLSNKYGNTSGFERVKATKPKFKYLYVIDKSIEKEILKLKKEYPKCVSSEIGITANNPV